MRVEKIGHDVGADPDSGGGEAGEKLETQHSDLNAYVRHKGYADEVVPRILRASHRESRQSSRSLKRNSYVPTTSHQLPSTPD